MRLVQIEKPRFFGIIHLCYFDKNVIKIINNHFETKKSKLCGDMGKRIGEGLKFTPAHQVSKSSNIYLIILKYLCVQSIRREYLLSMFAI